LNHLPGSRVRWLPARRRIGNQPGGFSSCMLTVQMGICGFPPFVQRTHKGWGTAEFC